MNNMDKPNKKADSISNDVNKGTDASVMKCNGKSGDLGDNHDNDYTNYVTPITPQGSQKRKENLTFEEVKEVYLKLKANNLRPTAIAIREQLKHGSFTTLQKFVTQLNKEFTNNRLNDIQKEKVTDEVIKMLVEELTERVLKVRIKDDDKKIDNLSHIIVQMMEEQSKTDMENARLIDEYKIKINEMAESLDKEIAEKEVFQAEVIKLTNQLTELTTKLEKERIENEDCRRIMNILRIIQEDPNALASLSEIIPKCN